MKNIFDYLKQFGIIIEECTEKVDDNNEKYEKVPQNDKWNISALMQYLPGIVINGLEKNDIQKKIKKVLDGAYKVSITDGMHLAKSKVSKGAYRGSLLLDKNNQVAGQAELFPIDDTLKIAQTPRFFLSLFNAVSLFTGQYYMAEISNNLSAVERKTDQILNYLENKDRSKLWASNQLLNEIIGNYEYIVTNQILRESYYGQIIDIKKESLAKMCFFDLQIRTIIDGITNRTRDFEIRSQLEKIYEYCSQFWYTVYLYEKSVLCEISLGKIDNPDMLNNMRNDILGYIQKYKNAYAEYYNLILEIINNAKAYNLGKIPRIGVKSYNTIFGSILTIYDSIAQIENHVSDKKEQKKKHILELVNKKMEDIKDVSLLSSQLDKISMYQNRITNQLEILKIGDEIYLKFCKDD